MMSTAVLEELKIVRNKLFHSLEQLEESIDAAHESFKERYGSDHFSIVRLESYYPALDKQREYILALDILIMNKNFDNYHIVTAICATSDFIKEDAKSLLNLMQNGKELLPDNLEIH